MTVLPVITAFFFLNDENEGGEIRFNNLSRSGDDVPLDIQSKKVTALVWSNVQNDPMFLEDRTLNQVLPVTKGEQYVVKMTFYLRSYDDDNCNYDAFNEAKWW